MDDDLIRKIKNLSLQFRKHKTPELVINDIKKISAFLKDTCDSSTFDLAFIRFVESNMKNVSSRVLLECSSKMQKENAKRINNSGQKDNFDDYIF